MTDIEIANSIKGKNIHKVAKAFGLKKSEYYTYGENIAKVNVPYKDDVNSKLILVTSINPTSAGNGKTTVAIGLADAMRLRKKKVGLALREPSLGPVFGMKGGATGGGYSQVIPMEDINLHFTGDFHAITSANNLLCSAIDNHIFQGNTLNIDKDKVLFNRCLDLNDRALRDVEVTIDAKNTRKDKFNITAASEIMAILSISKSLEDLKEKLGNIMVALNKSGEAIYARDLKAQDAMTILLKDAIKPNLVQTLAGNPTLVHCGPFANIAHGCSSILATNISMQRNDYTITEAGFGADLGAEKFIDFKCRIGGIKPSCVVIVATIPALKLHGGAEKEKIYEPDSKALFNGFGNLKKHIENIKNVFNIPVVVTLNKYASDIMDEICLVQAEGLRVGSPVVVNDAWAQGGVGVINLADAVIEKCEESYELNFAYDLEDDVKTKIEKIAKNIYGAYDVKYSKDAENAIKLIDKLNYSNLPIIMAKTQYSLSDDKDLLGCPVGFDINVTDIELRTGAGFIVVKLGKMLLMPGLNKTPAYERMTIHSNGKIEGLY